MNLGLLAFLCIGLVLVLAASVLWARWRGPKRCAVSQLEDELHSVLARILLSGEGSVVIDAPNGENFLQVCSPVGGGLLIDVPQPQFGDHPSAEVREALDEINLGLRDWGMGLTYESVRFDSVGAAITTVFEVLYGVFKLKTTDFVSLEIDYSPKEPPPQEASC
jgi:hypothetical protein